MVIKMDKKSILLINNNYSDINTLTNILENDYEVTLADSALIGIKKARDNKYTFVIIDVGIDDGQGIAVLELIRDTKTGIPIISIDNTFDMSSLFLDSVTSTSLKIIKKPFKKMDVLELLDQYSMTIEEQVITNNIVILGMDNVGKTSLTNRFLHDQFVETKPTFGLNLETYVTEDNCYFKLFDLGGQEIYKDTLWEDIVKKANALVFVVDSSTNTENLKKSSSWFWDIVQKWLPKTIPLLLIANKNDLPGVSLSEIIELFKLKDLSLSSHSFNFISTSAKTGQGMSSFKWLLEKTTKQGPKQSNLNYSSIQVLDNNFNELLVIKKESTEDDSDKLRNVIKREIDEFDLKSKYFELDDSNVIFLHKYLEYYFILTGSFNEENFLKKTIINLLKKTTHLILPISDISVRNRQFNWLIHQEFPDFYDSKNSPLVKEKIEELGVIFSHWDENYGPKVINSYFSSDQDYINPDELAITCFMTAISIFGHQGKIDPCFVSIPLKYSNMEARIYFDSIDDSEVRGGQRIYSLITLLPELAVINLPVHDEIVKKKFDEYKINGILNLELVHQDLIKAIV
jgi:small GTP-binding protein